MNISVDGLRRQLIYDLKDLKLEISKLDQYDLNDLRESFNSVAQKANVLALIYDDDCEDDFNDIEESVQYFKEG